MPLGSADRGLLTSMKNNPRLRDRFGVSLKVIRQFLEGDRKRDRIRRPEKLVT